jgi:hypothetical protein
MVSGVVLHLSKTGSVLGNHGGAMVCGRRVNETHMTAKSSASFLVALTALVGSASIALAGPIAPAGKDVKEIKEVAPPVEREDIPVHPITAPYFHEDSFIGTDVRPVFVSPAKSSAASLTKTRSSARSALRFVPSTGSLCALLTRSRSLATSMSMDTAGPSPR